MSAYQDFDRSLHSALALQLLDKYSLSFFFFFLVAGVLDRDVSVPFLLSQGRVLPFPVI